MFQLINPTHQKQLIKLAKISNRSTIPEIVDKLQKIIKRIRTDIPVKKRISYGRYSIIKDMGSKLYPELQTTGIDVYKLAVGIFNNPEHDQFVRSLAVQLISIFGLETHDLTNVLVIFEKAAADKHWEMRECSAGFIRKLIKNYPAEMARWYLEQSGSKNPFLRRFASESIRPVADNKWFGKRPEFCFSVLENLYRETDPYPRTSVGNNLSDWARIDKEKVYKIIEKLVKSGDRNSYWIAYRACRNLVKTEPIRVMNMLGVDEYKYKQRVHFRGDYQ